MIYYHGWDIEGEGFFGERGGVPVYRLYNPSNGDHHYTVFVTEKDACVKAGWKDEGVSWYSASEPPADVNMSVYNMTNEEKTALQRQYAEEIVKYTNVERRKAGLPELDINETFMAMAMQRAKEASEVYSHARPNGESCSSIIYEYGVEYKNYNGENLGAKSIYSATLAQDQVKGWMNSEGHRRNILRETSDTIGAGCYIADSGMVYCIQFFGNLHIPRKVYTWDESEIIIPTN